MKSDDNVEIHPAPKSLMEAMRVLYQARSRGKKVKFVRGR